MEFTLSLAHFCENDGPTSILCTQVLPVSCLACWPLDSVSSSIGDLIGDERGEDSQRQNEPSSSPKSDNPIPAGGPLDLVDWHDALVQTANAKPPHEATGTERHKTNTTPAERDHRPARAGKKTSTAHGDDGGCVSCSISLPKETIAQLPPWAPGRPKKDGVGRNGSPVMRTTEKVVAHWNHDVDAEPDEEVKCPQYSSPESFASDTSRSSYHQHELVYRTTSSPIDPNTYAILRRATIRTLSCEQLPRGLTSGALSFGDPVDGYTVAYKFRLPDPYARGCQRHYALLALAGQDSGRMTKATPIIWKAFRRIAGSIIHRTEGGIAHGQLAENVRGGRKAAMPVSSFLTGRTVDPDGYPRRSGGSNMRARGLAEMVGDELIFAHLHGEFTYLLQSLGRQLGGLRTRSLTDEHNDPLDRLHQPNPTESYSSETTAMIQPS